MSTKEFFSDDKIVSHYLTHGPHPAEKKLFKLFMKEKGKVLDLCGGAGRIAFYLAKKGFDVTVVDNSEKMIEAGKRKARRLNSKVKFILSNAEDICFDEEFDYVLIMENSLEHINFEEDRKKIVKNTYSSLKKGGIFITSFHSRFYPFRLFFKNDEEKLIKKYFGKEVNKNLYFHLFNPFEIRNLFLRSGFSIKAVIPINLLDKSNNKFKHNFIYRIIWPLCYTFWVFEK